MKTILYVILFLCSFHLSVIAQDADRERVREMMNKGAWKEAATSLNTLFNENMYDEDVYHDYIICLQKIKDYKKAEEVIQRKVKLNPVNPLYYIDLGSVLVEQKKETKANESFEQALSLMNGDDVMTQQIANQFELIEKNEWAIRAYERASDITKLYNLYSRPLAKLYAKTGQIEKAIYTVIQGQSNGYMLHGDDNVETNLLELIGGQTERHKMTQKILIKLLSEQPDNYLYTNLLIWLFSLQGNWDQALLHATALEKRSNDKGAFTLKVAQNAHSQRHYKEAEEAYSTIVKLDDVTKYQKRGYQELATMYEEMLSEGYDEGGVVLKKAEMLFDDFFQKFSDAYTLPIVYSYARIQALYLLNTAKAISILQKAIGGSMNALFTAQCKLQLGDYYILEGDVWEAALVYSQVDKSFRQDILGEEARFRNAKLSYYRHDFEQAQGQLSVLKASTSEFIANDALYLSVLITENTSPSDSSLTPFRRFATADLLLFQNKYTDALSLLTSILLEYPKTSLVDDIYYLQAKVKIKQRDYTAAITLMNKIVEEYNQDVLGDDAMFQIGYIYDVYLHDWSSAQKYFERLIIEHPGSSFIGQARTKLQNKMKSM